MKHLLNNASSGEFEPWVTLDNEGIHYSNKFKDCLLLKYNVIDPSVPCSLYIWTYPPNAGHVEEIIIDNILIKDPSSLLDTTTGRLLYTFSTPGEKNVYLKFNTKEIGYSGPGLGTCGVIDKFTGAHSMIFPKNHNIGECAFSSVGYSLVNISIPSDVTNIGSNAFWGNNLLSSIVYDGTIAQWNAITKGANWNGGIPTSCTVHCTNGNIPINEA